MMTEQAGTYQVGGHPGLELLAERMAQDPRTMAWVLAEYRRQEGMSHEQLRARLGVSQEGYLRLALCLRPERDHFGEHLRQITGYTGIDVQVLGNLIRQVDMLRKLEPRVVEPVQPVRGGSTVPVWQQRATLRAARDHSLNESKAGYEESAAPLAASAPAPAPMAAPQPDDAPAGAPTSESAADVPLERGEFPDDGPTEPPGDRLA